MSLRVFLWILMLGCGRAKLFSNKRINISNVCGSIFNSNCPVTFKGGLICSGRKDTDYHDETRSTFWERFADCQRSRSLSVVWHNGQTCIKTDTEKPMKKKVVRANQKTKTKGTINSIFASFRRTEKEGTFGGRCVTSRQCDYDKGFCLYGRCSCIIGYSYNFTMAHCVERCTRYGNKFSSYKKSNIKACNVVVSTRAYSSYACTILCRQNTDITCISAEFDLGGSCNLCNLTSSQLKPVQRRYGVAHESWTLSYRHCLE